MLDRSGRVRITGIVALAASVFTIGAAPLKTELKSITAAQANAARKVLAIPRLYHFTSKSSLPGSALEGDMCMGDGGMFAAMIKLGEDPAAMAALNKGCSMTKDRKDDGSVHIEVDCERAAGAAVTSRTTISGTPAEMHMHAEMGLGEKLGGAETIRIDQHSIYVGKCPASIKPGQVREANGEIIDPGALFGAPAPASAGKAGR